MCVEMSDLICAIFSDREDFSEIAFVEKHSFLSAQLSEK